MTKEQAKNAACDLMHFLSTIQDEMNKGGEAPSKNEVDFMYDLAVEINEYFDSEDD